MNQGGPGVGGQNLVSKAKRRWLVGVALAAVGVLGAAGCSNGGNASAAGTTSPAHSNTKNVASNGPTSSKSSAKSRSAKLTISPANGSGDVRPDAPIAVTATNGTIRTVSVHTAGDAVTGSLNASKTSWRSAATLNVGQSYTVTATGVNSAGKTVRRTSTFRTLTPASTFTTHISEGFQETYGVGMPIQLTFSQPITNKAAVEQALHISTSKPVVGAWSWIDDEHVDFRPRDYWPADTEVSFDGQLDGVQGADGMYGAADLTQQFKIGSSVIVVASASTHHMQLYVDGHLKNEWPISTGTPGDDTPNGTFLTIEKANPEEMKPSDIAPGQPGYYDLQVPWSVRFTWSGDFLHDAPWSVNQQGSTNVSHGCVNMPPAAAEEYYNMAVPGDPVTITGSPVGGTAGDGYTDWFDSWATWLSHSATHEAVQAGPGGSSFVSASSVPASTASAPLTTAPANNSVAS